MIDHSIACILTVYEKTSPAEFAECLNSIYSQKYILPSELVICFDGQRSYFLIEFIPDLPDGVNLITIYLHKNTGPGRARHIAILSTNKKYIAIMDSDDICSPLRFFHHYSAFSAGCDFHAGQLSVLSENSTNVIRKSSLTNKDFLSNVRYRTPFNNQTLAFSRYLYFLSGGYPDMRVAEDWVLMARIYPSAANPLISPEVFVSFRENSNYSSRRTTILHSMSEYRASCLVHLLGLSKFWWPPLVFCSRLLLRNLMPKTFLRFFESFFRVSS